MKQVFIALKNKTEYEFLVQLGIKHFIIGPRSFSRLGDWTDEDFLSIITSARSNGVLFSIEFDLILTENFIDQVLDSFLKSAFMSHADLIYSIRLKDLGLIHLFFEKSDKKFPLHLLLESGMNHRAAIQELIEIGKETKANIKCLSFSKELPFIKQRDYSKFFELPFEVSLLSPILLYTSPRPLLKTDLSKVPALEVNADSGEDGPHHGFVARENRHGTFLYHPKHLSLLDKWDELIEVAFNLKGLIDLRLMMDDLVKYVFYEDFQRLVNNNQKMESLLEKFSSNLKIETMRGFYQTNKTTVLFSKLKNQHLVDDRPLLGVVVDRAPGLFLYIQTKHLVIKRGQRVLIKGPQGDEQEFFISKIKDVTGKDLFLDSEVKETILAIDYIKNMTASSRLYLIE